MTRVIGLCGSIGAGKGAVSEYLIEKYGFIQLTVGDVVREHLAKIGMEPTRDNSVKISEEMRQKYGITYWIQKLVDKIKSENIDKVIVDGVRLPSDTELLEQSFGENYALFKVDASPEIRFERLKTRARPGFPKTLEEFFVHENRENKIFNLDVTFKLAKEIIDNSTSLEDLHERVDKIAKKYPKLF